MAAEPAVGTKIKRARERLRWTQKKLADELGVSQKTVDNWEHGRTAPKSSIGALEEVLGVRLADYEETPDILADRWGSEDAERVRRVLGAREGGAEIIREMEEEFSARPRGEGGEYEPGRAAG